MGWGSSKEALIAENAAAKRENELLREQLKDLKEESKDLRKQLRYAHEALVAKESPEAYRDRKYNEELAAIEAQELELTEEEKKARTDAQARAKVMRHLVTEMEKPLFKDRDDMIEMLTRSMPKPMMESHSLHGNDES